MTGTDDKLRHRDRSPLLEQRYVPQLVDDRVLLFRLVDVALPLVRHRILQRSGGPMRLLQDLDRQ